MTDNTIRLDSGAQTMILTDNESKLLSAMQSIFARSDDISLGLEFLTWDMLSDEAFRNFERKLDSTRKELS